MGLYPTDTITTIGSTSITTGTEETALTGTTTRIGNYVEAERQTGEAHPPVAGVEITTTRNHISSRTTGATTRIAKGTRRK